MTMLSNLAIQKAKPKQNNYSLKDGDGLHLQIKTNGTKNWLFRFYWDGTQQKLSFGTYPEVDLKTARQKREEVRALVAQNKDPRQRKKQQEKYGTSHKSGMLTFAQFTQHWKEFKLKKLGVADKYPQTKHSYPNRTLFR